MRDDSEIARKLKRAPSVSPEIIRGLAAIFKTSRDKPAMPVADELAALLRLAEHAARLSEALMSLGWDGATELEQMLTEVQRLSEGRSLSDVQRDLDGLASAAMLAHKALGQTCGAGRPTSNLTHMIQMLATIIEGKGGVVDARQSGEVCQAFGVLVEVLDISVANHRETVRAALARRDAKQ